MAFFESLLTLLLVAILLLQVARRLTIPYPTMLAAAGVVVAALPGAPTVALDPQLMLALFIAPALLDAGYDLPPRELRRYWRPLVALAVVAIVLTTAAVAAFGVFAAGLPLFAAIALGAIVAPPDAAAAHAVLGNFALPRRTVAVLKGESLLNDATALLIFTGAVALQSSGNTGTATYATLALAVPGGIIAGILMARLYLLALPLIAGTLGGTLLEFVATFVAWLVAERLHLSAVLCVVAYAMTLARYMPDRQRARDRVHSYSVWEAVVFLTNVLAFLLMGLQARLVVQRLAGPELAQAFAFAGIVFAVVVAVRLGWVMLYNRLARRLPQLRGDIPAATAAQGLLVSWSGMRGLLTLVTAIALPQDFPQRDLIVLSAFTVVIGTLVVQGLTLGPLIRWLKLEPDTSFETELSAARTAVIDAALESLDGKPGDAAEHVRNGFISARTVALNRNDPQRATGADMLRLDALAAQRRCLSRLRESGEIDDDVFHTIEEELDWHELSASPADRITIEEG